MVSAQASEHPASVPPPTRTAAATLRPAAYPIYARSLRLPMTQTAPTPAPPAPGGGSTQSGRTATLPAKRVGRGCGIINLSRPEHGRNPPRGEETQKSVGWHIRATGEEMNPVFPAQNDNGRCRTAAAVYFRLPVR